MHIITGLGRSGTSFIAEIFQNLGYEMGVYNLEVDAGFENAEITGINKSILNGDFWGKAEEIEMMRSLSKKYEIVKDPRFIITLGIWIQAKAKIDSIILCNRNYEEIIESSERTQAGMMAIFNGWPAYIRKNIMLYLRHGIDYLCFRNNIPIHEIRYPESIQHFTQVQCLTSIIKNKRKLYKAWQRTRRLDE